jgi:hypothetical protein
VAAARPTDRIGREITPCQAAFFASVAASRGFNTLLDPIRRSISAVATVAAGDAVEARLTTDLRSADRKILVPKGSLVACRIGESADSMVARIAV